MTTAKTVSKNTFSLLMGSILSQALRIVYAGILVRYIGAEGFGQISTATALVSLLILVVNFGLDTVVIRDVAGHQAYAAKYAGNVAFIRFILAMVLAVVTAAVVAMSPYAHETRVIIVIYALAHVFDAFSDVARSIFHAYQRMEYAAVIDFSRNILNVAVTLLGISLGWSLIALVLVSAFASLVKLIASAIVMQWRFVRPVWQIDLALCHRLFSRALPFFILVCIGVVNERLSIVILSWLDTAETVGIYSAATTLITALLLVPMMFNQSIFPSFSQYYQTSAVVLGRAYRIAYKVMLLIGLPMGAGMMLVSESVIPLVYGPGFEAAFVVTNILAIQLLTMVGYVNGAFLKATDRQMLFVMLRVASVVLNTILLLALVPKYHYIGAALAVAIPAIIEFGLYSVLCHRYAGLPFPWSTAVKAGVSTVLMSGMGYFAMGRGVSVVWVILLGPVLYLSSLVAVNAISAEERRAIGKIVFVGRLRRALTDQ